MTQIDGEFMIVHPQGTLDGHTNLLSMPFLQNQIKFHLTQKHILLATKKDCLRVGVTNYPRGVKLAAGGFINSHFGDTQMEENLERFHIP